MFTNISSHFSQVEKGIWKTVLYHKEAGETYYLLDEGTLQAFLQEFHICLVW